MVGTGMLNPSVSQVALGALVTNGETYVDGFHDASWVGAGDRPDRVRRDGAAPPCPPQGARPGARVSHVARSARA